jgi:pSer/pThr/pTyr-binding forkhead associated (FHA) protein
MDHHQPGPTLATLLHEFKPAQPFRTTRSRTALSHLRDAFTNGHPLAVLNHGWNQGSNCLVERFIAEVGASASFLRIPEDCQTELKGLRQLIQLVGFDPGKLGVADLKKLFIKFLDYRHKRKHSTVLILEDTGRHGHWICDYVTELVEMDACGKFGLMIVLMRQTNFDQLGDEQSLDRLSYRTAKHISLTPFTQAETRKFVRWRIEADESADIGKIFDFQSITLIHELCDGMPDAIEYLSCASLALADYEDTAPVTTDIVMRAGKDLPAPLLARPPTARSRLVTQPANGIPTLTLPDGPTIVLDYRGKTVRQIPLNQQRISIGRAAENDLCIDSPYISRQHATIFRNGPETAVLDLDSKNGTFVNSRRIQVQTIADQDEIVIGYHTIRFLDPNAPRIRPLNSIGRTPRVTGNVRHEPRTIEVQKSTRARR